MPATQAIPAQPSGTEFADNLIRVTERLSELMENEVGLLRGNRARDIKALQGDKESLTAVYQRLMSDLRTAPHLLGGIDEGRRTALRRAANRLEDSAMGNAVALRTAIEANHRLMEAIADAIRSRSNDNSGYGANARLGTYGQNSLNISVNQTL
jgi:flagellar biosynthesis/type III secretory pathway chaperone